MLYRTVSVLASCTLLAASAAAQPMRSVQAAYVGAPAAPGLQPAPGKPPAPGMRPTPGSEAYLGCWQTRSEIYGGFHVAFCTQPTGAGLYHVRGQGFDCQGLSSWQVSPDGRRFDYQMSYGDCQPRAGWTPDRMVCAPESGWSDAHGTYNGLVCVYHPAKPGEHSIRFAAFRQ